MKDPIQSALHEVELLSTVVPRVIPRIAQAWLDLHRSGWDRDSDHMQTPRSDAQWKAVGSLRSAIRIACRDAQRVVKRSAALADMLIEPPIYATELAIALSRASRGTSRSVGTLTESKLFPSATAKVVRGAESVLWALQQHAGANMRWKLEDRLCGDFTHPLHLNAEFWSAMDSSLSLSVGETYWVRLDCIPISVEVGPGVVATRGLEGTTYTIRNSHPLGPYDSVLLGGYQHEPNMDLALMLEWGELAVKDAFSWEDSGGDLETIFTDAASELTDLLEQQRVIVKPLAIDRNCLEEQMPRPGILPLLGLGHDPRETGIRLPGASLCTNTSASPPAGAAQEKTAPREEERGGASGDREDAESTHETSWPRDWERCSLSSDVAPHPVEKQAVGAFPGGEDELPLARWLYWRREVGRWAWSTEILPSAKEKFRDRCKGEHASTELAKKYAAWTGLTFSEKRRGRRKSR